MNIYDRVFRLERLQDINKPRQAALVFLSGHESRHDALMRYESVHGCKPKHIVEIESVDCSRPELMRA